MAGSLCHCCAAFSSECPTGKQSISGKNIESLVARKSFQPDPQLLMTLQGHALKLLFHYKPPSIVYLFELHGRREKRCSCEVAMKRCYIDCCIISIKVNWAFIGYFQCNSAQSSALYPPPPSVNSIKRVIFFFIKFNAVFADDQKGKKKLRDKIRRSLKERGSVASLSHESFQAC